MDKSTAAQMLTMPDVIGEMIQDFIRPDLVKKKNKEKMDVVVERLACDASFLCDGGFRPLYEHDYEFVDLISHEDYTRLIVEHTIDPAVEVIMRESDWDDEVAADFFIKTMTSTWLDNMKSFNDAMSDDDE